MQEEIKKIIAKYLDNSISVEELEYLDQWRNADRENEKMFHELKATLTLADVNNNVLESNQQRVWNRLEHKISEEISGIKLNTAFQRPKIGFWLRAASVIVIFSLGVALGVALLSESFIKQDDSLIAADDPIADTLVFTSKASSKSEVFLPDGSKVWLNSNSEIKLPSDFKKNREVYLVGEAYFDVARHENNNFFYVHTSDIKVEVLGTEFNVKSYPEEGMIETTLEEGEIVLYKKGKSSDVKMTSLRPNQHASFIKKDGELHLSSEMQEDAGNDDIKPIERKEQLLITESIDTEKYTAWKDGHLIIDGEPFESFVKKLERWYDVEIEIKNERVKRLHFTANFKNETIEQALQALKIAHPFKYTFDVDKNLILIE